MKLKKQEILLHINHQQSVKRERGVTLTILVITIIVMLILAGASLSMIFDYDGLLKSSQEAQEAQKNHANHEEQKTEELINEVNENMKPEYKDQSGANSPKLGRGMVPVKWNGTNWIVTDNKDSEWYNYADKKWANIMLTDGLTVEDISDANTATITQMKGKKVTTVGSMFVWIPRYAYQIASNYHTSTTSGGTINIKFLKDTTNTAFDGTKSWDNVSGQGKWNIHPAFSYGEEVSGIWVSKFEASTTNCTTAESTGQYNGIDRTLQVKPGITSWRGITVNNIYTLCLNYNTALNSHMMKNSEWGATAYLAQSSYGKNAEVWINNNSSDITGSAGNSVSAGTDVGTTNDYTSSQGIQASTTGNVTGIYGMSGGAWEYAAAYVNNGNGNLTTYGSSLVNGVAKMKDVYNKGANDDYATNYPAANKYGDAIYETSNNGGDTNNASSWYNDHSTIPYTFTPFFVRGGNYNYTTRAGLFAFGNGNGDAGAGYGFRPVLIVL